MGCSQCPIAAKQQFIFHENAQQFFVVAEKIIIFSQLTSPSQTIFHSYLLRNRRASIRSTVDLGSRGNAAFRLELNTFSCTSHAEITRHFYRAQDLLQTKSQKHICTRHVRVGRLVQHRAHREQTTHRRIQYCELHLADRINTPQAEPTQSASSSDSVVYHAAEACCIPFVSYSIFFQTEFLCCYSAR